MASLSTVLLLNIFPALLPPIDAEDRDFYEVLGISKSASEQAVRKAYKVKSLSLHPDKIAQRRASAITAEEAAKEYQLVQEAHSCLSEKALRQKYHAVKCSPTRYRFLTQGGGLSNQIALLKNLSAASFADKTKLVVFVSIFPIVLLIQPILIAVKCNQLLAQEGGLEDASWVAVLIPWWIFHGLYVAFWLAVSAMAPPEALLSVLSTVLEQLLWLIALLLLALRWDQTITSNYTVVFIPVYLALIFKWVHYMAVMQVISKDMDKMMSRDKFMKDVLRGREPEELEEDELKELNSKYVVVSQIPADVEHDLEHDEETKQLTDDEKEEIKVASSKEFEAASEGYAKARWDMAKSMVLDVAFLILLVLKIDDHADMSWWAVFSPILVVYILRIFSNCFICCCAGSPIDAEDVAILSMKKDDLVAEVEGAAESEAAEGGETKEENGTTNDNTPTTDSSFPLNSKVLLHGLRSADFNDKIGIVNGPLTDGRQEVYIKDLDKTAALKIINMKSTSDAGSVLASAPVASKVAPKAAKQSTTVAAATTKEDKPTKQPPKSDKKKKKDETMPSNTKTPDAGIGANSTDAAPESKGETSRNAGGEGNNDEASIEIDEETYKAYQSAYAAAEENAMEDRMKAGQGNCAAVFTLTMICLLVAKLEQATEAEEERDEKGDDADVDVGFNTLWLLFPLFLIAGFMISCCACLIYSAPDPEELMRKQEGEGGDAAEAVEEGGDADNPIVFAPPPPPPAAETATATEEAKQEEAKEETEVKVTPPAVEEDMNDLD